MMNTVAGKQERGAGTTSQSRLILGVDGGGTKTMALVAGVDDAGQMTIIGRGLGGPSNLRLQGVQPSLKSLDNAIDEALAAAGMPGRKFDCAVLALAGSTSPDVQRDVSDWASKRDLSMELEIAHDAMPVLARGTADGWGIALIVGTGSVAVGVDEQGRSVTKGGWGHWFGDKGSGFFLGYKALAAVAEASDDIGPKTMLSEMVLERLGTEDPRSILMKVSEGGDVRRAVAALAPLVIEAAMRHDKVSRRIVKAAVKEAVKLVAAVAKALAFDKPYPLAIAGGVICSSQLFRDELLVKLNNIKRPPAGVTLVYEPVLGCLKMAQTRLAGLRTGGPGAAG